MQPNDEQMTDADPPEENLPAERPKSWDEVLERAAASAPAGELEPFEPSRNPTTAERAIPWLKLGAPVIVLAIYLIVRFGGMSFSDSWSNIPTQKTPQTITGVAPAKSVDLSLDRETRDFVARLEALRSANQWNELKAAIRAQPKEAIRNHPIVAALLVVSRTRTGERNVALEREIEQIEAAIAGAGGNTELLREVRLAHADQILSRMVSTDVLLINIDNLNRLIGSDAPTPRDVEVRIRAARTFEDIGDGLMESGTKVFRDDPTKFREARVFYQHGLRFLVKSDRWLELVPVSPAARSEADKLVEKIRLANERIHGFSLSFKRDSSTWNGMADSPVHDNPSGSGK